MCDLTANIKLEDLEELDTNGKALRWQIGSNALHVLEHVYLADPFPGERLPVNPGTLNGILA